MNLTSKRKSLKKVYEPIGVLIAKTHITPNAITIISVILGVFSAYFFYNHKPLIASILLFMSGFFDLMDGVVARETDTSSKFGAVFDWLADKVVDGVVLFAVGLAYANPLLTIVAVVSNMLHTFIKPVAYSEIGYQERTKGKINDPLEGVGFFGRPETILTLVVFGLLENFIHGALNIGFQLIVILTIISLALRIGYLYKHYNKDYD
jgi:phosphatidylglycerophosphate synthase